MPKAGNKNRAGAAMAGTDSPSIVTSSHRSLLASRLDLAAINLSQLAMPAPSTEAS